MTSKIKTITSSLLRLFYFPKNVFIFSSLFIFFVMILQWLAQIQTLFNLLFVQALSFSETVQILIDAFFLIFKLFDDFTPISFILISLFLALSLTMQLQITQTLKNRKSKAVASGLGLGVIGAGCAACGGSVLAPLASWIYSGITVSAWQLFGDVMLLAAIALAFRELINSSLQYSQIINAPKLDK